MSEYVMIATDDEGKDYIVGFNFSEDIEEEDMVNVDIHLTEFSRREDGSIDVIFEPGCYYIFSNKEIMDEIIEEIEYLKKFPSVSIVEVKDYKVLEVEKDDTV